MAHRGTDNMTYFSNLSVGSNLWDTWTPTGVHTNSTPAIGTDESGHIVFSMAAMTILPDEQWPNNDVIYDSVAITQGHPHTPNLPAGQISENTAQWRTNGVSVSVDINTPGETVAIMTGEDDKAYTGIIEIDY
jgi:hypothetical protein